MKQLTDPRAEVKCDELMEKIHQLYPFDDTENLQPFAEYMYDKHIDHKEVEEKMEVLREHGIIDIYNEFTEWSQNCAVGIVVNENWKLMGYNSKFNVDEHLITKQGKMLIEKLCPELHN